jgi:hypothetical protein
MSAASTSKPRTPPYELPVSSKPSSSNGLYKTNAANNYQVVSNDNLKLKLQQTNPTYVHKPTHVTNIMQPAKLQLPHQQQQTNHSRLYPSTTHTHMNNHYERNNPSLYNPTSKSTKPFPNSSQTSHRNIDYAYLNQQLMGHPHQQHHSGNNSYHHMHQTQQSAQQSPSRSQKNNLSPSRSTRPY